MISELVFILILKQATCLVCNETISVLREVPETYKYTYNEAYEGEDCVIWCTKSRLAVNVGTRIVTKLVDEAVMKCCDGYIEDVDYHGDGLQCVPKCSPPCRNGYCRKPNECDCEWGFGLDPIVPNTCRPLCLEGCAIPECLTTCDRNTAIIEPNTCSEPCANGTCTQGLCQCQNGYSLSNGICEPICSSCEHGSCKAPGLCECEPGFSSNCGSCQPVCTGCEYGTCTAPDQCECQTGYIKVNGKCEPFCAECNGTCIGPGICVCDPGWYMNKERTGCLAHCDMACGNGSCVSPNVCECYPGYHSDQNRKGPRCVPVCNNCDGFCTAPGVCECGAQYQTIYTTVDGGECDCFDCDDKSRKCDKITCRKLIFNDEDRNVSKTGMLASKDEHAMKVIPATLVNSQFSCDSGNDTFPLIISESLELTYHWIYGTIIIVELVVIIIMLVVFNRKRIMNRLKTKKFIPKDKPIEEVTVQYINTPT